MLNYTFLFFGILFTTFLAGYVLVESFLPKLEVWKKIPIYLIGSAVISTFLSAFFGLIFGLSREVLLGLFCVFGIAAFYLFLKRKKQGPSSFRKNLPQIMVGVIIYVIYFVALKPAIFGFYNNYFVMSGPNWQDTAMHMSIIESITQGNFPPQAPYFSGEPLKYYYFSDLHASIVNIFFGSFFPEVLILLNPFWATAFYFSVFALAYKITRKKVFSIVSAFGAVFFGNMGFVNFYNVLIKEGTSFVNLVTSSPFNFNFEYLQMVPVSDYFLQNRPMMAGLSLVSVILFMLVDSDNDWKKIFVAGIFTGALLKFQMFGFLVAWMFFVVFYVVKILFRKITVQKAVKNALLFMFPSLVLGLVSLTTNTGDRSVFEIFIDTFSWGAWQRHDTVWYVWFFIGNFGVGFLVYIFSLFLKPLRKNPNTLSLGILSVFLLTIPLSMKFTLYEFDMLKFYYYLIPVISVLIGFYFANSKHKRISIFLFIFLTVISSITSFNLLIHSFLNKNQGYTYSDYRSGIWIRNNTPQKSVFVTMPTVHSAPSDIGGRLRIISYINWPHSHGFNTGGDNVFFRVDDVNRVYETGEVSEIKLKYGAKYIFFGSEEKSQFPNAGDLFDKSSYLEKIYDNGEIKIYEIL